MSRLRLAVIGAGHLGRIHARLATSVAAFDLVGIVDPIPEARAKVDRELHVPTYADFRDLSNNIDAAVIATPTTYHYQVGLELMQSGVHVLIEKPLASTVAEANKLVAIAENQHVILQVGHIERFNPAFRSALPWVEDPKYIAATRTSGYTFRSTDIGVVHDLMIHDIDIVLSLVDSPIHDIRAVGVSILGKHEDVAQARVEFNNGCVANLSASRTSFSAQRSMQIFSRRGYVGLDFAAPSACHIAPNKRVLTRNFDIDQISPIEREYLKDRLFDELLPIENLKLTKTNAILEELEDFAASITEQRQPQVTGGEALQAVQLAEQIVQKISEHNWHEDTSVSPEVHATPKLIDTKKWQDLHPTSQQRKAG